MISSSILSYSFNTLFIKKNQDHVKLLIYESVNDLEIKASILLNLIFSNNIFLLSLFIIFLIIDLYSLVPVIIAQIFNPIVELVIPIGIPSKEAKAEIEIHAVTSETKIKKCSI